MEEQDRRQHALFRLTTAAHHFLLDVLPFRSPGSFAALTRFVDVAEMSVVRTAHLEPILLRTLSVLDRYTAGRLPTLVDRYFTRLTGDVHKTSVVGQFRNAIEDVLRYRGVRSAFVQRAIAMIEEHYADPGISLRLVAQRIGCSPELLSKEFHVATQLSVRDFLSGVRLDRAARLLVTTDKIAKEIWSGVGFNHASTFNHEFKKRFHMSPLEYRACAIRPAISVDTIRSPFVTESGHAARSQSPNLDRSVLIVEDDENARLTMQRYFRLERYAVTTASTAADALNLVSVAPPTVILLDYHLPDMDGLDCLRQIRQRTSRSNVVVFSADWDLEDCRDEFWALGAVFLFKLCSLEDVKGIIDTCGQCVAAGVL